MANEGDDERWRGGGSGETGMLSDNEGNGSVVFVFVGGREGECGGEGLKRSDRTAGVRAAVKSRGVCGDLGRLILDNSP
jgi:hypothetical protein